MSAFVTDFSSDDFKVSVENLHQILDSKEKIPITMPAIQRGQAWPRDMVLDLFDSLCELADRAGVKPYDISHMYFLGPVVIHHETKNINNSDVIKIRDFFDGQQRISNLTLMLCAIRDYFFWKNSCLDDISEIKKASEKGWEKNRLGLREYRNAKEEYGDDITYAEYVHKKTGWDINTEEYQTFKKYWSDSAEYDKHFQVVQSNAETRSPSTWESLRKLLPIHKQYGWPETSDGINQYLEARSITGDSTIKYQNGDWRDNLIAIASGYGWSKDMSGVEDYYDAKKIFPNDPSYTKFNQLLEDYKEKAKDLGWKTDVKGYLLAKSELEGALSKALFKKVVEIFSKQDYVNWKEVSKNSGTEILVDFEKNKPANDFDSIDWSQSKDFKGDSWKNPDLALNLVGTQIHQNSIVFTENDKGKPRVILKKGDDDKPKFEVIQNYSKFKIPLAKQMNYPVGSYLCKKYSGKHDPYIKNIWGDGIKESGIHLNYNAIMEKIDDIFNSNGKQYFLKTVESRFDFDSKSIITEYKPVRNEYGIQIQNYYHTEKSFKESCTKLWFLYYNILQYSSFTSTIIKNNEKQAYDIFLNMNSKSKPLTFFDIIRAKILIKLNSVPDDYKRAEDILDHIANLRFFKTTPSEQDKFLIAQWNSRKADGSKKGKNLVQGLIEELINVGDNGEIIEYLEELKLDMPYFVYCVNKKAKIPKDIISNSSHKDLISRVAQSSILPRQTVPLKMSIFRKNYIKEDFYKIHEFIEATWVFIAGLTALAGSKTENFWIECCAAVNDSTNSDEALQNLITKLSDRVDYQEFSLQDWCDTMQGSTTIHQHAAELLLRKIEYGATSSTTSTTELSEPSILNVEHILPKTLPKEMKEGDNGTSWKDIFNKKSHQANLWKLGNLTLLFNKTNKAISNNSFEYKLENGYRPKKTEDQANGPYNKDSKNVKFSDLQLNINTKFGLYHKFKGKTWTEDTIDQRTRDLIILVIKEFDKINLLSKTLESKGWGPGEGEKMLGHYSKTGVIKNKDD